jgi:AhpD family alkylhydroperoxidase
LHAVERRQREQYGFAAGKEVLLECRRAWRDSFVGKKEDFTLSKLRVHTHESAPADSKSLLAGAEKAFGFVPNVSAVLAESPATLKAYMALSKIFDESSLTPVEREVAILTINEYNACHYCMAAHSVIADMSGVPGEVVMDGGL